MWWDQGELKKILQPKYKKVEYIDSGQNGAVFRAQTRSSDKPVAVKFIRVQKQDQITRKRLEAEIKAMETLDGKCAVRVYDCKTDSKPPYYVMEYLKLGDFRSRLKRKLSTITVLELFNRICECVETCHEKNITHRDIKPENILFRTSNKPILSDFGICKLGATNLGTTAFEMEKRGTPLYMAPEQLREHLPQSKEADIWALGTMLHFDIAEKIRNPVVKEEVKKLAEKCRVTDAKQRPSIEDLMISGVEDVISTASTLHDQKPKINRLISLVEALVQRLTEESSEVVQEEGPYLRQRMVNFNEVVLGKKMDDIGQYADVEEHGIYLTSKDWYLKVVPSKAYFHGERSDVDPFDKKRIMEIISNEAQRFLRHMKRYKRWLP